MTSLSKKVAVVAFMGISAFGVISFIPTWTGPERQEKALARLDLECRAYRSEPMHHNAEVCRDYDLYAPHEVRLQRGINTKLDDARTAAARGDDHASEMALRGLLADLPELDEMGTLLAALVGSAAINRTLDFLDAHPSLDRTFVLRDARLELLRHPLEGYGLQRRWNISHEPKLSQAEIADKLDASERATRDMERAMFRFDEAGCKAVTDIEYTPMCAKLVTLARTSARLDAMRR